MPDPIAELLRLGQVVSNLNAVNWIELQKLLDVTKREKHNALQRLLRFWSYLLQEHIDLAVMETSALSDASFHTHHHLLIPSAFFLVQLEMVQAQRNAMLSFAALLERYPNNAALLRTYDIITLRFR